MSSTTAPEFGPNDWFVEEKYQQFLSDPSSVDTIWRDYFAEFDGANGGDAANDATRNAPTVTQGNGASAAAPARTATVTAPTASARTAAPNPAPTAGPAVTHTRHQAPPPPPPPNRPTPTPAIGIGAGTGAGADRRAGSRPPAGHREDGCDHRPRLPPGPRRPRPSVRPPNRPPPPPLTTWPAARRRIDEQAEHDRADTSTPLRGMAAAVVKNMTASLEVPTATSVRAVPAKLLADNRIVINNFLQAAIAAARSPSPT